MDERDHGKGLPPQGGPITFWVNEKKGKREAMNHLGKEARIGVASKWFRKEI